MARKNKCVSKRKKEKKAGYATEERSVVCLIYRIYASLHESVQEVRNSAGKRGPNGSSRKQRHMKRDGGGRLIKNSAIGRKTVVSHYFSEFWLTDNFTHIFFSFLRALIICRNLFA